MTIRWGAIILGAIIGGGLAYWRTKE